MELLTHTKSCRTGKIDELRAKSVTPEKFKEMWGYSIDEYLEKMMKFAEELDANDASALDK